MNPTRPPLFVSTDFIPERDKVAFWREEFGRKVLRTEFEVTQEKSFQMTIELDQVGDVRVGRIGHSGIRTYRDRKMASDGEDAIGAIIPLQGTLIAGHGDKVEKVQAGQLMALSVDVSGSVTSRSKAAFASLMFPRDQLLPLMKGRQIAFGKTLSGQHAGVDLIRAYLRHVTNARSKTSQEARALMGRHLTELMALALGAVGEAREAAETGSLKTARVAAILDCIAQHFADPGLSVGACASRLGISSRSLQQLLAETGTSFGEEVRRRRLERAFAMLTDIDGAGLRVTDVALECGFSDMSNFNRAFRARFGDSPSGVRR